MDAATIDAARLGNRSARATLLGALQDPWYRFCLSLLGDPDRAREATQETALRFLRDLHRFRGDSQLRTWSMGIALNVVREMRRAKGGRDLAPLPDDETSAAIAPGREALSPAPDDAADAAEQRERLRAVLAELPERQREAVVLRYFEDLSVEETAAAMDCAPGTVKATVHQALKALKRKLQTLVMI